MTFRKIQVGVVQATPVLFDIQGTIAVIEKWLKKAKEAGCELVLFPESFIPCYPRGLRFDAVVGRRTEKGRALWLDYWKNSLEEGSEEMAQISTLIKEAGMMVALGATERASLGGSLYCSLFYFNANGRLLATHRKLKPTGLERFIWADGDASTLQSLDSPLGKIGGLICWENYMPLARYALYEKGIDIYLAPTADARPSWTSTMQHIALEGRCFVLSCNQFVQRSDYPARYQEDLEGEEAFMSPGGSVIFAPDGSCLAGPLWDKEGLLTATLDQELLIKSKLDFDVIGHYGRPDVFQFACPGQPESVRD